MRRRATDKIITRIDAFDIYTIPNKEKKYIFSVKRVVDDKRLTLNFDLNREEVYLLDLAKVISAPYQKDNQISMMIHLPNAHDFLVRFQIKDLIK